MNEELREIIFLDFTQSIKNNRDDIINSFVLTMGEKYRTKIEEYFDNIIFVPYINGREYFKYFRRQTFIKKVSLTKKILDNMNMSNIFSSLVVDYDNYTVYMNNDKNRLVLESLFGGTLLFGEHNNKDEIDVELLKQCIEEYNSLVRKLDSFKPLLGLIQDNSPIIGQYSINSLNDMYDEVKELSFNSITDSNEPFTYLFSVSNDIPVNVVVFPILCMSNQALFHEIEHALETDLLFVVDEEDESNLFYKTGITVSNTECNNYGSSYKSKRLIIEDEAYTEMISKDATKIFEETNDIFSFLGTGKYYIVCGYETTENKLRDNYFTNKQDIIDSKISMNARNINRDGIKRY